MQPDSSPGGIDRANEPQKDHGGRLLWDRHVITPVIRGPHRHYKRTQSPAFLFPLPLPLLFLSLKIQFNYIFIYLFVCLFSNFLLHHLSLTCPWQRARMRSPSEAIFAAT